MRRRCGCHSLIDELSIFLLLMLHGSLRVNFHVIIEKKWCHYINPSSHGVTSLIITIIVCLVTGDTITTYNNFKFKYKLKYSPTLTKTFPYFDKHAGLESAWPIYFPENCVFVTIEHCMLSYRIYKSDTEGASELFPIFMYERSHLHNYNGRGTHITLSILLTSRNG